MLVLIATLIKMFVCLFVSQFIYHQKSVFQLVHYQCASSQKHTYEFFRLLYFLGATAASGRWLVQEFRSDFTCLPSSQFSRRLTVLFRNSVQRDKPFHAFQIPYQTQPLYVNHWYDVRFNEKGKPSFLFCQGWRWIGNNLLRPANTFASQALDYNP